MIIFNEVRIIGYEFASETNYTVDDESLALQIRRPDATADTYETPDVTVDDGATPALTHALRSLIIFDQAGGYLAKWACAQGQEVREAVDMYFVSYTGIQDPIRGMLGKTDTELPDTELDRLLFVLMLELEKAYPCIGAYSSLSIGDQILLDSALTNLAAASVRRNPNGYVSGNLVQVTEGPVTYKYGTAKVTTSVVDDLINTAYASIATIDCVASARRSLVANSSMYSMPGRRKGYATKRFGVSDQPNLLYTVTDPVFIESCYRQYERTYWCL